MTDDERQPSSWKFDLNGIAPRARCTTNRSDFQIDENGTLIVTAEDKEGGNTESITITDNQSRLTPH